MKIIKVLDAEAVREERGCLFLEFEEPANPLGLSRTRTLLRTPVPDIYQDVAAEAHATGRPIEVTLFRSPEGWAVDWLRLA